MGTQSRFDHIQISTKVTTEKRTLATKMGVMKIKQTALIGLCLVTLMGAFPKSYESTTFGPPEEGCEYEYKTITEKEQVEDTVIKCEDKKQCECREEPVTHCLNYTTVETLCVEDFDTVCETITLGGCLPVTKTIDETYLTPKCFKKEEEHCKYHWEERKKGEKVWAKIPSSCEKTYVDMCEDVQQTRTVEVIEQEFAEQQNEVCAKVKRQSCELSEVVKQECVTNQKQVCKEIETKDCKEWHILVDVPKERTIPVLKCKDITLSGNSVETEVLETEVLETEVLETEVLETEDLDIRQT